MSAHKSDQEKVEAWGKAIFLRSHGGPDLPECLGEVEACGDQSGPQWLLGVRKKEDWEEKPSGVTFMCGGRGNRQKQLHVEIEEKVIQSEADQKDEIWST